MSYDGVGPTHSGVPMQLTPVGFEPTQLALVELESTPLDHSGKLSSMDEELVIIPLT